MQVHRLDAYLAITTMCNTPPPFKGNVSVAHCMNLYLAYSKPLKLTAATNAHDVLCHISVKSEGNASKIHGCLAVPCIDQWILFMT